MDPTGCPFNYWFFTAILACLAGYNLNPSSFHNYESYNYPAAAQYSWAFPRKTELGNFFLGSRKAWMTTPTPFPSNEFHSYELK